VSGFAHAIAFFSVVGLGMFCLRAWMFPGDAEHARRRQDTQLRQRREQASAAEWTRTGR